MYLLDTTVCFALLEDDARVRRRMESLAGAPLATCVTVQGELAYMARKSRDTEENLGKVERLLRILDVIPTTGEVAETYGWLKSGVLAHFGPRNGAKRRAFKFQSLGVGDNDLWIAAAAKLYGLTVATGDTDFLRIAEAGGPEVEIWLPPLARPLPVDGQEPSGDSAP